MPILNLTILATNRGGESLQKASLNMKKANSGPDIVPEEHFDVSMSDVV